MTMTTTPIAATVSVSNPFQDGSGEYPPAVRQEDLFRRF